MEGDTRALEQYLRSEGAYASVAEDLSDVKEMSMDALRAEFEELVGDVG